MAWHGLFSIFIIQVSLKKFKLNNVFKFPLAKEIIHQYLLLICNNIDFTCMNIKLELTLTSTDVQNMDWALTFTNHHLKT